MANEYCTLAELKAWLSIPSGDTGDDTVLAIVNEAAAREIDAWCGRHFYQVTETRYFTADDWDLCRIDDLSSITSLRTDDNNDRAWETTWSAGDYDLEPWGEKIAGVPAPHRTIRLTPSTTRSFPTHRKGVEVTGTWGWDAVPVVVKQANLLQAARYFKRKDSPFGVAGVSDFGVVRVSRLDPDIQSLLEDVARLGLEAA